MRRVNRSGGAITIDYDNNDDNVGASGLALGEDADQYPRPPFLGGHRVPECNILLHRPPVIEGAVQGPLLCVHVVISHALHILPGKQAQHCGEVPKLDPGLAVLDHDGRADRGGMAAPTVVVREVPLCGLAINGPRGFTVIDAVRPKNVHMELAKAIHWGDGKGKRE